MSDFHVTRRTRWKPFSACQCSLKYSTYMYMYSDNLRYVVMFCLGGSRTDEQPVYDLAVSLAKRHDVDLWEVYMSHVEFLFDSECVQYQISFPIRCYGMPNSRLSDADSRWRRLQLASSCSQCFRLCKRRALTSLNASSDTCGPRSTAATTNHCSSTSRCWLAALRRKRKMQQRTRRS